MTDSDRCYKALAALAVARQATLTREDLGVYLLGLDDISDEGIIGACMSLLRQPRPDHSTTMPSVGDIRREVARLVARRADPPPPGYSLPPRPAVERRGQWRSIEQDVAEAILARREGREHEIDFSQHHDAGNFFVHNDDHGPRYRCGQCQDTGWLTEQCHGSPHNSCGARQCYPHPYVTPCACGQRSKVAS